ncbi:MAG: sulfotransferase family protein [Candidatus Limnocylindria bacterium]
MTESIRSGGQVMHQQGPGHGPLFLVGCARTGSTLLRHILNRAPSVSLASETHFFSWARRHRLASRLDQARRSPKRRAALLPLIEELFHDDGWVWVRRNASVEDLVERLLAGDLTQRSLFSTLIEQYAISRGHGDQLPAIIGEKTPAHLYRVPTLDKWFPGARFIHTFRDPRGIYASELQRWRQGRWGPKARYPWLPPRVIDPLLPTAQAIATLRSWLDASRLHREYEERLRERYMLLRFEDLVTDPERAVRQVCQFLGLAFTPSLLEEVDVVGSSFAEHRHAAAGFDATAADRWMDEVHPLVRTSFARFLGRRLAHFGYQA